ncbi:oxepin-CoA hydrolase, alternative type [Caldimonas thermodepolymerans]|jgi:Enoyl-CoA hydratase/carnithine racemase|uniref:oxepin-CoA hydrolase, alternative type n=1 Tax=Caldimonas thermodepolymerans TaxID=215580 RepID=UPI0024911EFE|nr:enoyl-CoA hydratase [Caldimonas thermodepolymerans]
MSAELTTERQDRTLILTLNDPQTRNALSEQLVAAGVEALSVAESSEEVRCVVITGAGGQFCSGGNLQQLLRSRRQGAETQTRLLDHFHRLIEAIRTFPKPVIAAVEGAAAGGGCSLALACDLIVAARDAHFTLAYNRIGLSPDGGATWALMQALPRTLATQLIWLSDPVGAEQMHLWGVVNRVTDKGQALAQALSIAQQLAELAPNALASSKELLNQWPGRSLPQQLDAERDCFVDNLLHPNAAEGIDAFLAKRAPGYR